MQLLRGTKDILPSDISIWQYIYYHAQNILQLSNYKEIRTPIIESTSLFNRSIGDDTDIVNKEMYSFQDQGSRYITLRPEGTASVARAFISNRMYAQNKIHRLWYYGPMFRYERPQQGRQRQFHQLGIECLGSDSPLADVEVIRLAIKILNDFKYNEHILEINSIGNAAERNIYKYKLKDYLEPYFHDLDNDSKNRLQSNPIRILDTKNNNTLAILQEAPRLISCLETDSLNHFDKVCEHLQDLNIMYHINHNLVRGLDYYNYTAFEIKENKSNQQNTICGGGRYDHLIKQIGGPQTPAVGWAIGIERLILLINNYIKTKNSVSIYIVMQGNEAQIQVWNIIQILEKHQITFELDLSNLSLSKQLKKANLSQADICLIIGETEIQEQCVKLKWLKTRKQCTIHINKLSNYLYYIKKFVNT